MAIIQPPTVPASPSTVPLRGNKGVFSGAFESFLGWFLPNFSTILTAINSAYTNALEALNSANTATSAAAAALATANAVPWASGTTYQQYANVISPADGVTYRRLTAAGSGTTDPSADSTNYGLLQPRGFTNMVVLRSTQTWTPPGGVTKAEIIVVDGGQGGAYATTAPGQIGYGGKSSVSIRVVSSAVTYTATVGAGGSGGTSGTTFGSLGGASSLSGAGFTTITSTNGDLVVPGGVYGDTIYAKSINASSPSPTGIGQGGPGTASNGSNGTVGQAGAIIIRY